MGSILSKNDSLKIQQEWWPNAIRTHGNEPESHLKLLTQMGYKIYEIDGANNKLNLVTSDYLMKTYPNSKLEDINIFCKSFIKFFFPIIIVCISRKFYFIELFYVIIVVRMIYICIICMNKIHIFLLMLF